jgi:hypothetical protein
VIHVLGRSEAASIQDDRGLAESGRSALIAAKN